MKATVLRFEKPCEWCGLPFSPHEADSPRFCCQECLNEFSWALLHWATRQWVEGRIPIAELDAELEADVDAG